MRYFTGKHVRILVTILLLLGSSFLGGLTAIIMAPHLLLKPLPPSPSPPAPSVPPAGYPLQFGSASPVVDIARQVGPAVVGVTAMTGRSFSGDGGVKQGSGVIFDGANGYIVTNNHVIAGAGQITVSLDSNQVYPATLVGSDERSDLAVIRIEGANLPQARL
ncbi:MAG: trypsin-like peptidase domain-containing protein, partial [Moorella sp. (in: Bacteria)]|nr:trypsin-like peptidase domain-containing protein [Moorella sp. (in: firmicutes)]